MVYSWWVTRYICPAGDNTVRSAILHPPSLKTEPIIYLPSYLQNGNILAARTFISHFTSHLLSTKPSLSSSTSSSIPVGDSSEVTLTTDPLVNFCQIAVLTCQRAQGERNKAMREAWVRLCGTYQSKGGVLASPNMRKVTCWRRLSLMKFLSPYHRFIRWQVLNELAQIYFAIPPPRTQPTNPFGDMISGLFGGGAGGAAAPARRLSPSPGAIKPSTPEVD
jgi:golgi to ER traffic protein 4